MKNYIALLRGINVSGQKKIKMAELKGLLDASPLFKVSTYIQSGNVLFSADEEKSSVQALIEKRLAEAYGYHVSVLVIAAKDFRIVRDQNPYINRPGVDAKKLYVTFLWENPNPEIAQVFDRLEMPEEFFVRQGQVVYLYLPNGAGRAKLSNNFIENKLGVTATTRNWNTVCALGELAAEDD